ncbi:MAG: carboxypeptidase regulatory-like domain-containing protein [Bryobacteraceae bacterium]
MNRNRLDVKERRLLFRVRWSALGSLALILGLATSISTLPGQVVNSTIVGVVTDQSGASVPNATVQVRSLSTGAVQNTATTEAGTYTVTFLDPQTYSVRLESPGFKAYTAENVVLGVSTTVRVNAILTPGDVSESVTVSAENVLLETEHAEVGRNLSSQTVTELPVENRDVHQLATTLAGVGPPSGGNPTLNGPGATTSFSANGITTAANSSTMDGTENREMILGGTIFSPAPELVEEVRVTTSNYAAEFGHVGGASVNIVTKGGTNSFHGAAYEFNRVAALAARNFFNVSGSKPGLTRNEFGGVFSGPIKRNKTFFLGAYRDIREISSTFTTATIPNQNWINGNFSGVPGLALYDPQTGSADGSGRRLFPNNIIPQNRISQLALKINPYFPAVNLTSQGSTLGLVNNYAAAVPSRILQHAIDGRVDHYFSDDTKMFVRLSRTWANDLSGSFLPDVIGNGLQSENGTIDAISNVNHTFSPTLISELRLAFSRYVFNVFGIPTQLNNQALGVFDPSPTALSTTGIVSVNINGFAAVGTTPTIGTPTNYPAIYTSNIFAVSNTWTKTAGRHVLKWGGLVNRYREEQDQAQGANLGPRGSFVFGPGATQLLGGPGLGAFGATANSFAAYLLGAPNQIGRTYLFTTPTNRQTELGLFAQDTYQVTRSLSLDLGLRYELFTTIKPRLAGGAGNYDFASNTYLVAGYGAIGLSTGVRANPLGFEPRIGAAYRVNDNSVLRAGFGISHYQDRFGAAGGSLSVQPPVLGNVQIGTANTYRVAGPTTAIPGIVNFNVPSSGVWNPAPDQPYYSIPFYFPTPYVMSYNLTYQRRLFGQMAWDIGYVGNLGRQLYFTGRPDAASPGTGVAGNPILQAFGHASTVTLRSNGLTSNYNALQTTLAKRFSNGYSFSVAYAFSKSLGYSSTPNALNYSHNYGPINYYPHLLTITHLYELPFGRGKPLLNRGGPVTWIVSGWQVNGLFRYASGASINTSADATSCNCPGNGQVPNVVGSMQYLGGIGSASPWFSSSAFATPTANQFGNAGIGIVHGPSLRNYDFSLFRRFALTEGLRLEYRAEFYHLTNTPFFGNPNTNISSGAFGTITSATNSREIQMGMRLTF